jgi:5-methyltetrahydropteroyltriglutamate--homocysteine methyltransferase
MSAECPGWEFDDEFDGGAETCGRELSDRELGLGVVNPRTDEVEQAVSIVAKAEKALEYYRPDQLFLNADCGFGCFAGRSVNVEDVAYRKLWAMVEAARILRTRHG